MEYLTHFFEEQPYPEEAKAFLLEAAAVLLDKPSSNAVIERYIDQYREGDIDFEAANQAVAEASKSVGISEYTGLLVFYILLTEELAEKYRKRGISMDIYQNTIQDLLYKAKECKAVHGVWGAFVASWFVGFYELTRFALGRLQFELSPLPIPYQKGDRLYPKGTLAINMHIPSSGPLTKEQCEDSFRQALDFFAPESRLFMCDSWLLYPAHRQFLPSSSNILMFMDFFDIISQQEYPKQHDLWRIFGSKAQIPASQLPRDSGLQRAYADWIEAKNPVGSALGVFER
ncbi:MAG: acyltransferase domain-containing protein [Oscillospiraceae bacterium]